MITGVENYAGPFYQIKNNENRTLGYLLGTIHLDNEEIIPLPLRIYKAYGKSHIIAFENYNTAVKAEDLKGRYDHVFIRPERLDEVRTKLNEYKVKVLKTELCKKDKESLLREIKSIKTLVNEYNDVLSTDYIFIHRLFQKIETFLANEDLDAVSEIFSRSFGLSKEEDRSSSDEEENFGTGEIALALKELASGIEWKSLTHEKIEESFAFLPVISQKVQDSRLNKEIKESLLSVLNQTKAFGKGYKSKGSKLAVGFYGISEELVLVESHCSSKRGIDCHLMDLAEEDCKEIIQIDDANLQVAFQKSSFPSIEEGIEQGEKYLDSNAYQSAVKTIQRTLKEWKRSDCEAFERNYPWSDESKKILNERNTKMCENMCQVFQAIQEKDPNLKVRLFTAVGMAHLGGKQGLIKLLKKSNYTVIKY